MMLFRRTAMLLAIAAAGPTAAAAEPAVQIELNKLEPADGACRVYTVLRNEAGTAFESFKLDLVLFGGDGVIARRLAVEAGPLRAGKTAVKLFDVAGLPCAEIGSVLLNDVVECRASGDVTADCLALTSVSSRADVKLVK